MNQQATSSKSDFSTPATVERRRSVRQEATVEGWLSDPSNARVMSQQQQVLVSDLSLHGIGLRCQNPPEKGAAHWLVIATDRLHLSSRVRVVNVRQREDGQWDVGAEFY